MAAEFGEGEYLVTVSRVFSGQEPWTWTGYAGNVSDALAAAGQARDDEVSQGG